MANDYEAIYDAIVKKNIAALQAGDLEASVDMYHEHGVVLDKVNHKSYTGKEQHKEMIGGFFQLGKVEFNVLHQVVQDVGKYRFYVDSDFEVTFDSGLKLTGNSQQLYEKVGSEWKCVYEGYEMHPQ